MPSQRNACLLALLPLRAHESNAVSPPPAVDFGIPTLQKHMQSFRFPWLLSNVLDAHTGKPLGGAERSRMVTWQGVKVGLMGLVEREVGPAAAWSSRLFVPSALYS